MGKRIAQLAEGGAAEQGGDAQAVGLQGAAQLDQRAGQIVDRLQRIETDRQVEARLARAQYLSRVEIGDGPGLREGGNLRRHRVTDHQPFREAPCHRRQPVGQPFGGGAFQEPIARENFRPRSRRPGGGKIEKGRTGGGHAATLAAMGDWKSAALDLLFPPLCMACRAPVGGRQRLLRRLLEPHHLPGRAGLCLLRHSLSGRSGRCRQPVRGLPWPPSRLRYGAGDPGL